MIDYIQLSGHRYRVLADAATPDIIKSSAYQITLTGKIHYFVAPLLYRWTYMLLIEIDDALHGTVGELRTLYDQGDPDLNKITLIDQFGDSHEVVFVGDMPETNLNPFVLDECAYVIVPISLERTT